MQEKGEKRKQGHSRTVLVEADVYMSWAEISDRLGMGGREHARICAVRAVKKIKRTLRSRHGITEETLRMLLAPDPEPSPEPDSSSARVGSFR